MHKGINLIGILKQPKGQTLLFFSLTLSGLITL